MAIYLYSETVAFPKIAKNKTKLLIKSIISEEHYKCGDINIIFCSDEYLLDINKKHLQHNDYTDIITFDYKNKDIISGDIYISIERVKENAEIYKTSFINELHRIIIHGVLHLVGFKDKTSEVKNEMTAKEDYYLRRVS